MVTFYRFPKEHWKHLRTTNIVESPFASVRLRTSVAKRFKKVTSATALIWPVLLVAEKSFRRLDHAALLAEVADGAKYVDGVRVVEEFNERDPKAAGTDRLHDICRDLVGDRCCARGKDQISVTAWRGSDMAGAAKYMPTAGQFQSATTKVYARPSIAS